MVRALNLLNIPKTETLCALSRHFKKSVTPYEEHLDRLAAKMKDSFSKNTASPAKYYLSINTFPDGKTSSGAPKITPTDTVPPHEWTETYSEKDPALTVKITNKIPK